MTSVSLATRTGRAAATSGDLVCGLANPVPPQPFVGELGDPAADAATAIVDRLARAAGHVSATMPRVRIDGTLLATLAMRAAPLGGNAAAPVGTASTIVGSSFARIGGRAIARQGDASQLSPSSAMAIIGGRQSTVAIGGISVPEVPGTAAVGPAPGAVPPRTDFADPPAALTMLSRCSPARWTDLVPREHAVLVGDPVDVATGAVVTDAVDFAVIAPPLEFRRHYVSNRCDRDGVLGFGWTHNYDCAIWLEPGRVVLREDDGREIEFDALALPGGVARAGDMLSDPTGRLNLFCRGRFRWELRDRGRIRQFGPIAGESARERDRGLARLVRIVRNHDLTHELAYDREARLQQIRVGERLFLSLEYDEHGRIHALWTPVGERLHRHATFEYSPTGDLVDATDAGGGARAYEYVQHMIVRESDPCGASFYYGYDGFGPAAKCVRTWGTGGRLDRVLDYDGPTTRVRDTSGNVTTYRCDAVGLVREVVDPFGDKTRYRYDDALRLVQIVHPDGTSIADVYDERGDLVQRRGPGDATWRMRYDDDGRVVEGIDCEGGRWCFGYDGGGRLARVEDPLGHVTRVEYENGRIVRIVDPLGRVTAIEVDAEQRVLELASANRASLRFDYDGFGRMTSVLASNGERIVWTYDPLHRPVTIEARDEAVHFDRDASGHIVEVRRPSATTLVRRDTFGSIVAIEVAGVTLSCAYDDEGRLTAMQRDGVPVFSAQYDARGLVSVFTRADGEPCLVLRKAKTSRIESLVDARGTTRIEWDAAGRIIAIEADDGTTRRFSYRLDGLLLSASNDHGVCTFERDLRGAVLRQCVGDVVVDARTVDHAGRRHGFDVGDRVHVSYLRDGDGVLERIAVVSGGVHDIRIERSANRRERLVCERDLVEIHRDAWGRMLAAPYPLADIAAADGGPSDALLRPLFDAAGRPLVWDEDRVVLAGTDVRLCDPDSGSVLATIHGERVELTLPQLESVADDTVMPWHGIASDPTGLDAVCPTPVAVLEQRLAYRAWNPEVRPVTGMSPWDPDTWTCRIDGPAVGDGRLDQATLVRLLGGPFPRSGLRLGPL